MSPRLLSTLVHVLMLPVIVGGVTFVRTGVRSVSFLYLMDVLGYDEFTASTAFGLQGTLAMLAPVLAGLLAGVVGPYAVMGLGTLVLAGSLAMLTAVEPTWPVPATNALFVLVDLGTVMVWLPALVATIFHVPASLEQRQVPLLAMAVAGHLVMWDVGSLAGSVSGHALVAAFGFTTGLSAAAALAAAMAIPTIGLGIVGHRIEWPSGTAELRTLVVVALAALVVVLVGPALETSSWAVSSLVQGALGPPQHSSNAQDGGSPSQAS